ncbi:MAG: hypothetical protein ABI375_00420 [Rudaea sp.]
MSTPGDAAMPSSELILYRTEDARTRVEVRLEGGTVWLTQAQMAELFEVSPKTISEHLQNIFAEGECVPERTTRNFRIVRQEASRQVRRDLDPTAKRLKRISADKRKPVTKKSRGKEGNKK